MANAKIDALAVHLLNVLDDQRCTIGRMLHDATGQHVAALQINLSLVEQEAAALSPRASSALADSFAIAQGCAHQLQELSYSLYPPLLDEIGLTESLRAEADAFAKRSGIAISLNLPTMPALRTDCGIVLFRMFQASLNSVERAGAGRCAIRVACLPEWIEMRLSPVTAEILADIAIQEIRQRARQIGGRVESRSGALRVRLPLREFKTAQA